MAGELTGHVVGEFGDTYGGADSHIGLAIEGYDEITLSDGTRRFLLFPVDRRIRVQVSTGNITKGDVIPRDVPAGVLTFSGGRTASLPRRAIKSVPDFRILFAFDTQGNPTARVKIKYDAARNLLNADQDFYGAVAYSSYVTTAQKLNYQPIIETVGIHGSKLVRFGVICAFFPPSKELITFQIDPADINDGNSIYELYRITSQYITTPEGQFEKPPNFPSSGTYPDSPLEHDPANSMLTNRTHEVGYMDANGRAWSNSYFVSKLEPYVGVQSYVIQTQCQVANVTQFPLDLQLRARSALAGRGLGCK